MPEPFQGHSCYQKLLHCPMAKEEMGCDTVYTVYSGARWEITTSLLQVRPVIAHSVDAVGPLVAAKGPWQVQDGMHDFQEDSGLMILVPDTLDVSDGQEALGKLGTPDGLVGTSDAPVALGAPDALSVPDRPAVPEEVTKLPDPSEA